MICLDVWTNSFQQYHKKCMNLSVEKMNVDIGALRVKSSLVPHTRVDRKRSFS